MRLSLIIQAVDRMTAPVRKMTAGTRNLTAGIQKLRREGSPAARALDMVRGAAHRTAYGFGFLIGRTTRLAGKGGLLALRKSASLATSALKGTLGVVKNLALGGLALGGAGVGWFFGNMIGTASQFEQFQVVLENTEGSAARARKAMAWVKNFAKTTPYEVTEVMEAFVALKAYGIDPTNGSLESLGNAASGMGKPLMQAIEMLADAQTGEYERLKEFGIRAKVTGEKVAFTYMRAGKEVTRTAKGSAAEIQRALIGIFDERFKGMMDRQSRTLAGLWSNLKDMVAGFQLDIADAGVFDFIKGKVQQLLDWVNGLAKDGTLKKWAQDIADWLKRAFLWAERFLKTNWGDIKLAIQGVATVVWLLVKGIAAAVKAVILLKRTASWMSSNTIFGRPVPKSSFSAIPGFGDAEKRTRESIPRRLGPPVPTRRRPLVYPDQRNPVKVGGAIDLRIRTDPGTTATVERHSNANPNVPTRVATRGTLMSMVG